MGICLPAIPPLPDDLLHAWVLSSNKTEQGIVALLVWTATAGVSSLALGTHGLHFTVMCAEFGLSRVTTDIFFLIRSSLKASRRCEKWGALSGYKLQDMLMPFSLLTDKHKGPPHSPDSISRSTSGSCFSTRCSEELASQPAN